MPQANQPALSATHRMAIMLCIACCADVAIQARAEPTYQQKQFYEHQKRLELEAAKKREADERRRLNEQSLERMREQQRDQRQKWDAMQKQGAAQNSQSAARRVAAPSKVAGQAREEQENAQPPKVPSRTINPQIERDSKKTVACMAEWDDYMTHCDQLLSKAATGPAESGDWFVSALVSAIRIPYTAIIATNHEMMIAERLAPMTPNTEASQLVHQLYLSNQQFVEVRRRELTECLDVVRQAGGGELADLIDEQVVAPLDKWNADFLTPRITYWEARNNNP